MSSKIRIQRTPTEATIAIKLAEPRWFGIFAFCFAACVAWSNAAPCGDNTAYAWNNSWIAIPFVLYAIVLNMRIYGCAQRIVISPDHVDFFTMIGAMQIGDKRIPARIIERAELRERWVRLKGHKHFDRRVVLISQGEVLAKTTHLSSDDANLLLRSPFKVFSSNS